MSKSKKSAGSAAPKTPRAPRRKGEPKDGQLEGLVQKMSGMRLLGEIITWNPGSTAHKHLDIKAALQAAGLNEDVARELLPRHAFTRAAKKLMEDRVIDPVNEDKDAIKFQFTKRYMEQQEWKYTTECYLTLDKTLGKISCPDNAALESAAQTALDKAMEERTSADVTKMIQKLFDAEADLFPIRDQGGVYFVPQKHEAFTNKVQTFVSQLGGRVSRFPVPADTQHGDASVQDAILNGMAMLIHDHEEAVENFGLDTRHDTIERAAEKIKQTRMKVEAYAEYLKDKSQDLLDAVDLSAQKLTARVQLLTEQRASAPTIEEGQNRQFIFSYSVTAILRWMGHNSWKYKEARAVVDALLGADKVSEATIRAQLLGGRNGTRGEVPTLTADQIALLEGKRNEYTSTTENSAS